MGAGLKILAWFGLKKFVTINFPTHLAEFDPALWGGENSLSLINKRCVNVCVCLCAICLSDSSCDVNCNKSWLTICHGVHGQYLVEPLSISSTHRRSGLVLQMSLILNKEMTVFNLQKVYQIKTGERDISKCKFLGKKYNYIV